MGDFAIENGKVGKGVVSAILAAVKYLVIPVLIVSLILALLSDFAEGYLPIEELEAIRISLIVFAIPVIAMAFFVGFYPKGSYSRMTFGIIYVAFICLWIWLAGQGGSIDASIDFVGFALDFTALLLLFIFAASLKSLIFVAEAPSYREEYLSKKGQKAGAEPSATGGQAAPVQPPQGSELQTATRDSTDAGSAGGSEPATGSTQSQATPIPMPGPSTPEPSSSHPEEMKDEQGSE